MEKDNLLRIEVYSYSWMYKTLIAFGVFVMVVWFFAMFWALSVWMVVFYCLTLVAFIAYCWFYERTPTVISADDQTLRWRHLGKTHKIALSEIRNVTCEPYSVRTRYDTFQHLRLTVFVKDENNDDIEFNDKVDANGMLTDLLNDQQKDVPLMKMYRFLKKRVSDGGRVSG